MKFMATEDALRLLELARQVREEGRPLPPEIVKLKERIEDALRRATMFIVVFRVVDEGMVNEYLALRFELDARYAEWGASESIKRFVH